MDHHMLPPKFAFPESWVRSRGSRTQTNIPVWHEGVPNCAIMRAPKVYLFIFAFECSVVTSAFVETIISPLD